MFLSLLIRATTLCNSSDNFFKAATEYTQGLIARGFNATAMKKSWCQFTYSRTKCPILRKELSKRFFECLEQQFPKLYQGLHVFSHVWASFSLFYFISLSMYCDSMEWQYRLAISAEALPPMSKPPDCRYIRECLSCWK